MLSCDNICHRRKDFSVRLKEIGAESLADAEEQLCVDRGFVVDALQGAWGDTNAVGKPLVGVALAT